MIHRSSQRIARIVRTSMRTVLTIAAFVAVACDAPGRPGPPVRLAVASGTDTVVINGQRATSLPVLAIDAHGRTASVAAIRYELAGGIHVPLSPDGEVTCSQAGDLVVRASLASLDTRLSVLCRPVEHVRIPGPIQFVLGDSALGRPRDLPVEAYGRDGRARRPHRSERRHNEPGDRVALPPHNDSAPTGCDARLGLRRRARSPYRSARVPACGWTQRTRYHHAHRAEAPAHRGAPSAGSGRGTPSALASRQLDAFDAS